MKGTGGFVPRRWWAGVFAMTAALASVSASTADRDAPGSPDEPTPDDWVVTHLDSLMSAAGVPGAVLTLVDGCSTVVSTGVGYADRATRRAMDPVETRVRIGSISKVFTATAAVQLARTGRLGLRQPIARHLGDLELEWTYDEPVTLHHLLTHTSGLADRFAGSGARTDSARSTLAAYFRRALPRQQRPPGTVKIYSSHGIALAALVVERASGERFDAYADRHVFAPLGMAATDFRIPVDDPRLAVGYGADGEPMSAEYHFHIAPGADAVTTAADMARFLHHQLGCAGLATDPPIGPEGLELLQRVHFRNAEGLPGMAYGWEEWWGGGEAWLRKAGGAPGFTSVAAILPGRGLGVFLAYNRDQHPLYASFLETLAQRLADAAGGGSATSTRQPSERASTPAPASSVGTDATYAFLARRPDTTSPGTGEEQVATAPDLPIPDIDASRLAGWYRHLRYDPDSWERVVPLVLGRIVRVQRGEGEALLLGGRRYEPVSRTDPRWIGASNGDRIAFRLDDDGEPAYLFVNGSDGYERLAWWEAPPLHAGALVAAVLAFVAVLAAWVVAAVRGRRGCRLDIAAAASLLNLAFPASFAWVLAGTELWDVHFGAPALLTAASFLPAGGALAVGAFAALLLRERWCATGRRARAGKPLLATVIVAEAIFALVLGYWGLFGPIV